MRPFLASLFTGVVASLLTLWIVDARRSTTAEAQSPAIGTERSRAPSTPIPRKVSKNLFDERGLTPEEVINVSVYETCNRSVVNISTVSVRPDGFFGWRSLKKGRVRSHHQQGGPHPHQLSRC